MKVLYLDPAGHLGGAERAMLDLMAGVANENPDWRLALITAADGDLLCEARKLGVDSSVVPIPAPLAEIGDAGAGGPAGNQTPLWNVSARLCASVPSVISYSRKLAHAIEGANADLIHSNGFKMHLLAARAKPRATPILWHIHDFVRARPMMSRMLKVYRGRVDAVVANSASVASDVRSAIGARMPIFTVHNAVDLNRFSPEGPRLDLDGIAGIPRMGEGVRVGLVATMARWKGHEVFLRALSTIPPDMPIRAYIIGGPLYQTRGSQYTIDELRTVAARLGISDRVGFTGFVNDSAAAMRSLDVVVHASTRPEPFGLVIAEAMACGKPAIVSAAGGAAELVTNGADGVESRPGDAEALASTIMRLALDAEMRRKLGEAARATAMRRFTRERVGADMTRIYREMTARVS